MTADKWPPDPVIEGMPDDRRTLFDDVQRWEDVIGGRCPPLDPVSCYERWDDTQFIELTPELMKKLGIPEQTEAEHAAFMRYAARLARNRLIREADLAGQLSLFDLD